MKCLVFSDSCNGRLHLDGGRDGVVEGLVLGQQDVKGDREADEDPDEEEADGEHHLGDGHFWSEKILNVQLLHIQFA